MHSPGLKVGRAVDAEDAEGPADHRGSATQPVCFLEHKHLYRPR
jgi:pyruvate/2-oxoglutarate/acetoin dehydrogenase E1 component